VGCMLSAPLSSSAATRLYAATVFSELMLALRSQLRQHLMRQTCTDHPQKISKNMDSGDREEYSSRPAGQKVSKTPS
jgi:hypothetical protein